MKNAGSTTRSVRTFSSTCAAIAMAMPRTGLLLAIVLLFGACGGNDHAEQSSEAVAQDRVAYALNQIDGKVSNDMANTGIPGLAVAVVYRDRLVYINGFGVRQAGLRDPVDADTVFQLASLSKPITSTVLAAAFSNPSQWDTRIRDLDPDFVLSDPAVTAQLTVRDLMSHRSGLPGEAGDVLDELGYSAEEIFRRLRYLPLRPFRQEYNYSNSGLSEAGFAVARSRGTDWQSLSSALLYRPLGLTTMSSRYADFYAATNRAVNHVSVNGAFRYVYDRNAEKQAPAGGVSASVRDVSRWMQLLLARGRLEGRQLIDPDVLSAAWEPLIAVGPGPYSGLPTYYGMGWRISTDDEGRRLLSHSGAFLTGAATSVVLAPEQQLGIVVLTNASAIGLAEAITSGFTELALSGRQSRDWLAYYGQFINQFYEDIEAVGAGYNVRPAAPVAPRDFSSYVGTYQSDFYGRPEVFVLDGQLTLELGPVQLRMPLEHWDGDLFVGRTATAETTAAGGVLFKFAADTAAARVRLENYDQHGEGDFVRVR